MAVIWGPNSQGKTSLAEAIEFLLTGRTVRREFLASAAREFAGSLRNVHLGADATVTVRAEVEDEVGKIWGIERRLLNDYTGRDPCTSELSIGGNRAEDLSVTGIRLSQFPLEAPILMQHTLRYVVSAEPQKRADYFKALLEVSDLEEVRAALMASKKALEPTSSPLKAAMDRCVESKVLTPAFEQAAVTGPTEETISEHLTNAIGRLLSIGCSWVITVVSHWDDGGMMWQKL